MGTTITLSGKAPNTETAIDYSERDELMKRDPERARLYLLLGKPRAEMVLGEKGKREEQERKRFNSLSPADKVLDMLHGKISDDVFNQVERILKPR